MASRYIRKEIIRLEDGGVCRLAARLSRERRHGSAGELYNYLPHGADIEAKGVLLPPDAPESWIGNPASVWRCAEWKECTIDRKTKEYRYKKRAQVARYWVLALPVELSAPQRRELVIRFIDTAVEPRQNKVAIEWIIRADEKNPHAHILISTRLVTPDGFGKKAREMNPAFASKGKVGFIREPEMFDRKWVELQNAFFAEYRIAVQVPDRREYKTEHVSRSRLWAVARATLREQSLSEGEKCS